MSVNELEVEIQRRELGGLHMQHLCNRLHVQKPLSAPSNKVLGSVTGQVIALVLVS